MKKFLRISFQDLFILTLFAILIAYMFMSVQASAHPKFDYFIEIEVNDGDTLWSIASNYSEGISIHLYISMLRTHNQLKQDLIYPGQRLLVPQLESSEVTYNAGNYLLSSEYR
ncbi:hypothetical protein BKP37_11215 [Anaerobacillus alkalilacustris]|uniref:LysM domain-containing protein n=1 Tax=Anaerobacillus alkalilacustris TaxID=393763 RepID=A0A1S2LL10_9BACI|nr:LysM peptidoglycan-binding domain-containing protein [Anaerobacillus alkalilacustris]OIJ13076.1 hypothetical protein BKP37_11215 [Anaerobacillus alkalilacustris]